MFKVGDRVHDRRFGFGRVDSIGKEFDKNYPVSVMFDEDYGYNRVFTLDGRYIESSEISLFLCEGTNTI